MRRAHRLEAALAQVPMREGWADRLITLKPHWFDDVPEAYSLEGIDRRFKMLARAARKTNGRLARTYPGAALWLHIEMAHGFIHAHGVLRGPYVPQQLLEAEFRSHLEPVYVNGVCIADGRGFASIEIARKGIREVTKYNTKSGSPLDEDWLAGEARECTHPVLVARWMMATHGARLSEAYGPLRAAWKAADEDEDDEEAATLEEAAGVAAVVEDEPPCRCGAHSWKWTLRSTKAWVTECHWRGERALHGSRWIPPPEVRWGARHGPS